MPNPVDPQPYATDPSMRVFLLSYDPGWFNLNGNVGATVYAAEFVWPSNPVGAGAARPPMLQFTASDFLDYYITDTGQGYGAYRSTQGTPPSSSVYVPASGNMPPGPMLCLFNPQGWGRDVDIVLSYPPAASSLVSLAPPPNSILLFGTYGGPLYLRDAEYAQNYDPFYTPPGDPLFPFAPDALPLYTFPDAQGGANWPMDVAWPAVQVVANQPGQLHLKTTAVAGQDDCFTYVSYSGLPPRARLYNSLDRNIQIICLPLWIWADLPRLEGRAVTLEVSVNGASAEMSVLRFSRLPYVPELPESHLRIDASASIDLLGGALRQNVPLLHCEGPGIALDLTLAYSSEASLYYRDAAREPNKKAAVWSPFGHGWGFTYGLRVLGPVQAVQSCDPNPNAKPSVEAYLVQGPTGRVDLFRRNYDYTTGAPPTPVQLATYYPQSAGFWEPFFAPYGAPALVDTGQGFTLWSATAQAQGDFYRFDGDGKLVAVYRPYYAVGLTISWAGDDFIVTDSSKRTLSASAGGDGRITTIIDPSGATWSFRYDGPSLVQIDAPDGRLVAFGYDQQTFVMTSRTDRSGLVNAYGYAYGDAATRLLWGSFASASAPDATGAPLTHSIDWTTTPLPGCMYGIAGFSATYKNPAENRGSPGATRIDVGLSSPLQPPVGAASLATTQADRSTAAVGIDQTGMLSTLTFPSGAEINLDTGNVLSVILPQGGSSGGSLTFGRADRPWLPTGYTAASGMSETYDYVDQNGATSLLQTMIRSWPAGTPAAQSITYGWVGPGDLQSVSDGAGTTTTYGRYANAGYVGLAQYITETTPNAAAVTRTLGYDAFGRLTSDVGPDASLAWKFDALGRLTGDSVTDGSGTLARARSYDPNGLAVHFTASDGTKIDGTYDPGGLLRGITVTDAAGTTSSWRYGYDANGNIHDAHGADGTLAFGFDALDQFSGLVFSPSVFGGMASPDVGGADRGVQLYGVPSRLSPAASAPTAGWLCLGSPMPPRRVGSAPSLLDTICNAAAWVETSASAATAPIDL